MVAPFEGAPCLMFRMANARSTAIVEASVRVTLTREERLSSGDRMRRVYDLPLRRSTTPVFALTWTVFHEIDEASPLSGATLESLRAQAANLIITFTGIDDSLAAPVHTRFGYGLDDVRFGVLFVDIMLDDEHGGR